MDDNFLTKAQDDLEDEDPGSQDEYYSKDVQAAAIADNNMDPELMDDDKEEQPVTTQDMEIGDLDNDPMLEQGDASSYDEEATPAGDNVADQ